MTGLSVMQKIQALVDKINAAIARLNWNPIQFVVKEDKKED